MKKIILCLVILLNFKSSKIQAQVLDTAQYLIDSIQPKASYYVGKPLKILLNDLKIKPVLFAGILPTPEKPDTIRFKETWFDFYTPTEYDKRVSMSIKSAGMHIKFAQPIPIPKSWFWYGGKFEKRTWDRIKRRFFENCIIGSLEIDGI